MTGSVLHPREFEPEKYVRALKELREGHQTGVAPAMVAAYWDVTQPNLFRVASEGCRPDAVFDLASVSKVFGTAALAAVLVQRGWIDWSTPLASLIPETREWSGITLEHLLAHTAGLIAWTPLWEKLAQEFGIKPSELSQVPIRDRRLVFQKLLKKFPPIHPPGTHCEYSDLSFLWLGWALEEAAGLALDRAVLRWVWEPMGVTSAYYNRDNREPSGRSLAGRVMPTETCPWRERRIEGQVHDDHAWALGGVAGHAGAFAPVSELMAFARACFQGFFSKTILRRWWRPSQAWCLGPDTCPRTPGWDRPSPERSSLGTLFSRDCVGHLGYTGTSFWIDPARGVAVALLTNRVCPTRKNEKIKEFRPRFHNALYEDLHDQDAKRFPIG